MKKLFKERNQDQEKILEKVWQNGIIVFDTNVLLNLYRYNEEARDELLKLMKSFQKRLWMPYQVGLEFLANRVTVINWLHKGYEELTNQVDECKKSFFKFFDGNYAKHRHIDRKELETLFDQQLQVVKDKLNEWGNNLPDYEKKDVVKDKILSLYDGRVGNDYSYDELLEIYAKGRIRYDNRIPPGYRDDTKDKKEMGVRHVYGDLIAWMQIMDYAKINKKNIIFVGEDLKDDWWKKDDGKLNSPRQELLDEFKHRTGMDVVFHTQKGFVEASKKKIKDETIKEIERVMMENQQIFDNIIKVQESMATIVPRYDFSALGKIPLPAFEDIQKLAIGQNLESIDRFRESLKPMMEHAEMYNTITQRIQEMTGWNVTAEKKKKSSGSLE